MPLHGPVAPGQGEPRFDGVIIISEPFGKALQGHDGTLRDPCQPGIQLRALPLAHEVGKVLRQRDGLGDFGMLCAQLGKLQRFLRVALLCPSYDQPGRPAGVSSWWWGSATTGREGRDGCCRGAWSCAWRKRCA